MLDNEAAQALADVGHPKHRIMTATLEAVAGRNRRQPSSARCVVPTAVRVEALLHKGGPDAVGLVRFRVADVELTSSRADRSAALRSEAGGSVVDAVVMQVAEELADRDVKVTVYTADLTDLPRLAAATASPDWISVRQV